MSNPGFSEEQIDFLLDLLTPRCCHTTGMHDPRHFEEKSYICEIQKSKAFDRARALLGFDPVSANDAIPSEDCRWCNKKSKQE